jgi:hypothetical protein
MAASERYAENTLGFHESDPLPNQIIARGWFLAELINALRFREELF